MNTPVIDTPTTPDFAAIRQRQQATWTSGNYAVVGTTPEGLIERLFKTAGQLALERDILALIGEFNRAAPHSTVVPSEYLEVVATRR